MVRVSILLLLWTLEALDQRNDRNRLNSLSKAHLISKDSIEIGLVELEQPVEAFKLIVS